MKKLQHLPSLETLFPPYATYNFVLGVVVLMGWRHRLLEGKAMVRHTKTE